MAYRKLQLRRMTSAARAGVTFDPGELIEDTDTSWLWLGDGATAGGVGPFVRASDIILAGAAAGGELGGTYPNPTVNASHSGSTHAGTQAAAEATAAAALAVHAAAADPHTLYALLSGSKDFTGDVQILKSSLPLFRLNNSTGADTAGSRGSAVIHKGKTAAGTTHDMALYGAQHEGSGSTQLAHFLLQINTGSGLATALLLTGSDFLALFSGEVRHTHGRMAHRYRSSQQTFSATPTWKTVEWNGARSLDTGFSVGGTNNDTFTVTFAGRVRVRYSISLHIDTLSTQAVGNARLMQNGTLIPGSLRRCDHIDTGAVVLAGVATYACEVVVTAAVNDTFTLEVRSASGQTLQVDADEACITIERLQSAS